MKNKINLPAGTRLDDLLVDGLQLIQHPDYFCFSIDAVLLANFAAPSAGAEVLDIGTGTGVIPHLLQAKKDVSKVDGIDIQAELIKLARKSAQYNQLENKLQFYHLDLRKALAFFGAENFDYIVCNPPYRRPESGAVSAQKEEAIAKYELKCRLEDIIKVSNQLVKYRGQVAYIYRTQRLAELLSLMEEYNLVSKRMRFIHSQPEEPAKLVLVEAVKGGGRGLTISPPVNIYTSEGEYSPQIKEIYSN